jgi:retron-type reverse transcriptase
MKTWKRLYATVCSFDNLLAAARAAARAKKTRQDVASLLFDLEPNLLALRRELLEHTYRPGPYREFRITDPKPRLISAAPFRDRVVHHALCRVIEPLFDRTFIRDSYACRRGRGTHRALDRFTGHARRHPYVLKCDIRRFFPSLDHAILRDLLARRLRDTEVLWLIGAILEASNPQEPVIDHFPGDDLLTPLLRRKGLPIGNLTSQFWANVYLDPLDRFVTQELRPPGYVRYCDDFAIFGDDKRSLGQVRGCVDHFLESLRLKLHPSKCMIYPTSAGVAFLGFKVFPTHRLLLKPAVRRFRRRARRLQRAFAAGDVTCQDITRSMQAWVAHASHGDTYHLRERLLREVVFSKG